MMLSSLCEGAFSLDTKHFNSSTKFVNVSYIPTFLHIFKRLTEFLGERNFVEQHKFSDILVVSDVSQSH